MADPGFMCTGVGECKATRPLLRQPTISRFASTYLISHTEQNRLEEGRNRDARQIWHVSIWKRTHQEEVPVHVERITELESLDEGSSMG
jgi:hypothetical protein